jgi:hypothetical protein
MSRHIQITFDAHDPRALSSFWRDALGYVHPGPPGVDLPEDADPLAAWDDFLARNGVFAGGSWPQSSGEFRPHPGRLQGRPGRRKDELTAGSIARPPVRRVGPNATGQVGPELPGRNRTAYRRTSATRNRPSRTRTGRAHGCSSSRYRRTRSPRTASTSTSARPRTAGRGADGGAGSRMRPARRAGSDAGTAR